MLAQSMIGIGLNWWQAIIVIFVSQLISSIAMAFNSRNATVYHLGYPAVCRSVFGFYASYYFVLARAVLAVIWYGVQSKLAVYNPVVPLPMLNRAVKSVHGFGLHGKHAAGHLWPLLQRYSQSHSRINRHHDQGHACVRSLLADPLCLLLFPSLPAGSLFLVQGIHHGAVHRRCLHLLHDCLPW